MPSSKPTVLITRRKAQAKGFSKILEAEGIRVIALPTIEIVPPRDPRPLEEAIADLGRFHWIVFTSANGVRVFWEKLLLYGQREALRNLKVAAIGPSTARALQQRGVKVDLLPSSFYSEELAEALLREGLKGKRVLLPRAEGARRILVEKLVKGGAEVQEVHAYSTVLPREASRLKDILPEVDLVAFTSGQSVKNFMKILSTPWPEDLEAAAIGPITARVLEGFGIKVKVVAKVFTLEGLAQAVLEFFKGGKSCASQRPTY